MIVLALVVVAIAVLLAYVGRRFELAARTAAAEQTGEGDEAERLYRTQSRLLYVIAGAALLLAVMAVLIA
jgi:hypothetical protein